MPATAKGTKKTAAKRPPRKTAPAPVVEPAEDGPEVVRLTTDPDKAEVRIPLFSIDGKEYSIPARPRLNVALQFMHMTRKQGDTTAMDFLLEKLLGTDGYQALREYDALTPEHFAKITAIASEVTLGALEAPKA
ncbi:hypothetical protein EDD90_2758 [Streptomyces sp. Ag109_O5-1]|uniref:hypothetical protein n=1 Tax=Streptomyces sp. Ag109_O5-1 TaxID=1938851 RepID=UPI000F4F2CCE|nr:hypothetical protein [Streptomyces sp. Ag109_O5-1]RPE39741.1 hypothetical protein EDD90_2758 [Streptomyces sp. Ag109_O5-1]